MVEANRRAIFCEKNIADTVIPQFAKWYKVENVGIEIVLALRNPHKKYNENVQKEKKNEFS